MTTDWLEWHAPYDDPASPLSRRLAIVQQRAREAIDRAPPGPVRVISICAGQGRDVVGALADHPRRDDVVARLVELDRRNVELARASVDAAGLDRVEVIEADASITSIYDGLVPAALVLVCGVFGNIRHDDIHRTIATLPSLCTPGATVCWTRHRRPPDVTPDVRRWFAEAGFEELHFDTAEDVAFGIGTARFVGEPEPFRPGVRMFTFIGDGRDAHH
jgi:hypothetical protein